MPSGNDTAQSYMRAIGGYPLVTRTQEIELAGRIAAGDDDARSRLILGNLRLVVKIAQTFKGRGLPMQDLVSEGNIGLLRAVEMFDPAKGAKFSSYGSWWVKHHMRLALANQSQTIRIPLEAVPKAAKIRSARTRLAERLGREPTTRETARETGFTERTVNCIRAAGTVSLHDPVLHCGDRELLDTIPAAGGLAPDKLVENKDMLRRTLVLANLLAERERTVLNLYFGLDGSGPRTFDAIGRTIRVPRQGVRQIHKRALAKLRRMLTEDEARIVG